MKKNTTGLEIQNGVNVALQGVSIKDTNSATTAVKITHNVCITTIVDYCPITADKHQYKKQKL